ncbi:threonine/serine exporter family protein [Leifsonia kafniensis]|uniref:Threonine/serine exporter family protein n=1 Tax=Leifsonia kafniensis TaxID=475957 RepID=A0ABP7KWL7_9MICO
MSEHTGAIQIDVLHARAVLDLTMRLAEVIFASGAGAEDAVAAMQAVTRAYGLKGIDADITHTLITLTFENPATHDTISRSRNVKFRNLDFTRLSETSQLIAELIETPMDVAVARKRLATIVSSKPLVPVLVRRLGWSLVGAGAALLIGGGVTVVVAAFIATFFVDLITSALAHRKVPVFYQTVVGGAIGPVVAAIVHLIDPAANPSLVVVATIIMLLAGVTVFGAVHDILSGFYITGTARLVEAVLITGGLVTGVAGASAMLARLGLHLRIDLDLAPSLSDLPILLLGAIVIAVGFSLAVQMPWRALWVVCVLGALAEFFYQAGITATLGQVWASAGSAFLIGLIATVAAPLVRTPPFVVVVSALVPLVPGLLLFSSLMQVADGNVDGLMGMLAAAAVAAALAAGAILAQYLVQYVWGPARNLQRRFVGPIMALPLRLTRAARTTVKRT